ncbi:hypothetical protein D9Q98_000347 [Chlorella vulgaris]|uniref:J domain-containing protein n=1 Tax=Chlorella vulgaris TaxID=3077 RepID=A0A9D4Z1R8_CHLVU|nr:hypothetical protein D9Q98_000347 [Chlorella vulgaris]
MLARNPRHLVSCALMDPWSTLGVSKTADEKEIKKAHRKLVLQHHPDVKGGGDCVAYARFMHIQEAYELIMGKRQGKDIDKRPADKSGWQFHDWYWKFSMRRRKGGLGATAAEEEEPSPGTLRQQWQAQMAGLKQKAAAKRSRQHQGRRGAGTAAAAAAAAPPGSPSSSSAAREGIWRSMTKNATNADKAAAQQAAAQTLAGQRLATVAAASATGQQPQPQPQPQHSKPTAAAAFTTAPEAAPLHHAATSAQTQPEQEQMQQEAEQQGGVDRHSGSSPSHIERLRQLLEHAASLVRTSAGSRGAQSGAEDQPAAASQYSHQPPPSWRHVSGRMSLEQLTALLNGHHQARPEAGEQHPLASHPVGASSAVPADELLRERFEISMRRHRSSQRQPLEPEGAVPAGGPAANCSEGLSDEELRQQLREQYRQRTSTPHTAKFANRDEVEGRLSSQLAGLKRRAALKQEVETSC